MAIRLPRAGRQDARREVREEAHVDITDPIYVASFRVDDWRYRGETDQIKTLLFGCKHVSGVPRADDDVEEVRWVPTWRTKPSDVVETHRSLLKAAQEWAGVRRESESRHDVSWRIESGADDYRPDQLRKPSEVERLLIEASHDDH